MTARFMRGSSGRVRGDMALTLAGGFWAQGAILLSGILVTRLLGVEDRGHLALLWVIAAILSQLGLLGLPEAATFWVAHHASSAREIARSLAAPALLQAVALVALQALIVHVVTSGDDDDVRLAGFITLGVLPAILAHRYALAFVQGGRRFRAFNVLRILPGSLYAAAAVTLFVVDEGDLPVVAAAWTGTYILTASISLRYALAGLPAPARRAEPPPTRMKMLRFGVKGMLGSISPLDNLQLDQAVVGLFLSPVALGFYVVAVAFTNLPRLVAQNIGYVAFPSVAERKDDRAARRAMWRFSTLSLVACSGIVLVLEILAERLVVLFFGAEFEASAPLARILLLAALLAGVRRVLADGVRGIGHPGLGTLAEVVSWVCFVPAMAILAPGGGVEGVAWAVVSSSGVALLVLVLAVMRTGRGTPPREVAPEPVLVGEGAPG